MIQSWNSGELSLTSWSMKKWNIIENHKYLFRSSIVTTDWGRRITAVLVIINRSRRRSIVEIYKELNLLNFLYIFPNDWNTTMLCCPKEMSHQNCWNFQKPEKVKVMPKGLFLPCVSVICDISVLSSFPHDPVDCNLLISILENELCAK